LYRHVLTTAVSTSGITKKMAKTRTRGATCQ
jgi:hypothetical protein